MIRPPPSSRSTRYAVGDPVWLVISVGCLCPVMLENGNLAEARAEVLSAAGAAGLAVAAAWMAGGAAMSLDELAGQVLATEGV